MTLLDVLLAVVWLGVTLGGFWKGATRIVFGLGGAVLGVWLAAVAHVEVATHLGRWLTVQWLAAVLGWVLPAVLCLGLALMAGWGMERTLEALHLGWLDRLAGAVLAGVVGAAVLALLLVTAAAASPSVAGWCARSAVAPVVDWLAPSATAADQSPSTVKEPPASSGDSSSGR